MDKTRKSVIIKLRYKPRVRKERMTDMKRKVLAAIALCMAFALTACGGVKMKRIDNKEYLIPITYGGADDYEQRAAYEYEVSENPKAVDIWLEVYRNGEFSKEIGRQTDFDGKKSGQFSMAVDNDKPEICLEILEFGADGNKTGAYGKHSEVKEFSGKPSMKCRENSVRVKNDTDVILAYVSYDGDFGEVSVEDIEKDESHLKDCEYAVLFKCRVTGK